MSSAARLWLALIALAAAFLGLVTTILQWEREWTAEANKQLTEEVAAAQTQASIWARERLEDLALQFGQAFLLGFDTLESLSPAQRALLERRVSMALGDEDLARRLDDLADELRGLALAQVDSLTDLSDEEAARLRARIEAFTFGSLDRPLAHPGRHGAVASVLVISPDGEIVATTDEAVQDLRFTDEAELGRLARALEAPLTVPQPGDDAEGVGVTHVYVPLLGRDGPVGVLKIRFRGRLDPFAPAQRWTPPPLARSPWIFWVVALVGALGLGFGALATRRVGQLTSALRKLALGADADSAKRRRGPFSGDAAFRDLAVMEERLESLEDGAREKNRILEWLTGSLEEGLVVLDPSAAPVSINRWALENLRLGPAAEAGPAFRRLLEANPELEAAVVEATELGVGIKNRDLEMALPDGRSLGARLTVYTLKEEGTVSGLMLVFRDLESIRRIERALREASRLETLALLSASVAHEIRNPLNSVGIHLELLRRRWERQGGDPEARDEIQTIRDEIARLDRTIREFLGMTGQEERDRGPADLNATLTGIARFLKVEARDTEVAILTELGAELPPVAVPPGRLKQAILNLALNGIQAMPKGGTLILRSRLDQDDLLIAEVEDSGGGVPETIREQIFELHFTSKDQGSGLGLPITRQIVEEAGGSVDFVSEPGRGTRFRAYLPIHRGLA